MASENPAGVPCSSRLPIADSFINIKTATGNESGYETISNEMPGSSKDSMLLATDSYEDIQEVYEVDGRERKRSGTISEIEARDEKAQEKDKDIDEGMNNISIDDSAMAPELTEDEFDNSAEIESDSPMDSQEWKAKRKHVFILSSAGKPIYSRFGSEDKLVTMMGVMQALVSCVQINQDIIRCIVAGDHRFVFCIHSPIILVAVCQGSESVPQLTLQLNYVYYQIISILTYQQLSRIFEFRQNYDLRRLLSGSEKFLDNMLNLVEYEPGFLLGAVRCLPIANSVREIVTQSIIQHCGKVKNLVFAILIASNQLIALVRMRKYLLHPVDLHVIMNLVDASESFRTAESWSPICLPKFDSSGYLHGHISYLTEDSNACLLLLTVDRDSFFTLSTCKQKIVERLQRYDCMKAIDEAVASVGYTISQVGIPEIRHFLYKARSTTQYTGPVIGPPYVTEKLQDELRNIYLRVHQRMHGPRPLKIFFCSGQKETVMGWVTQGFELYAVFEPLITKLGAVTAVNKLIRWIKGEEDRLFILNSPTF